jgi:hypothetical protein
MDEKRRPPLVGLLLAAGLLAQSCATKAWAAAPAASEKLSPRSLASFRSFAPPLPTGAQPEADPRDFEGYYNINPIAQVQEPVRGGDLAPDGTSIPPFTKRGAAIFWHRIERFNAGRKVPEPSVLCEPSWKTRTSSMMQFVQVPGLLMIFQAEHHIARLIHIDGLHPRTLVPTYMGHSIGRWQGNTLIIDTIGFNDRGWFDFGGTPQSRSTHLVEQLSKQANGDIRDAMTFTDPQLFRHSFTTVDMYRRVGPGWEVIDEQICDENERSFDLELNR